MRSNIGRLEDDNIAESKREGEILKKMDARYDLMLDRVNKSFQFELNMLRDRIKVQPAVS